MRRSITSRARIRISVVRLQGLEVDVPPRSRFLDMESAPPARRRPLRIPARQRAGRRSALLHFQVETPGVRWRSPDAGDRASRGSRRWSYLRLRT